MPKIDNETKLDFDDVLIMPQRSTLTSRSEIILERTFHFYHSPRAWKGVPIMCANMGFCSFEMAKSLAKHKMIACLHKYHTVEQLYNYFNQYPDNIDYTFVSIGYKKSDLNHLLELKDKLGKQPNICIDVPNGHMDVFVKYCHKVRENFPESIIIAGNVTNISSTQELLIYGGVDIVKVGIGGGCFVAGTKVLTNKGYKNIEDLQIGDNVLTHLNRYKKVIGAKNRTDDNIFFKVGENICTANHQFYAVSKKDINLPYSETKPSWVYAADLNNDYLLVSYKDNHAILQDINVEQIEYDSPQAVYDIEIEEDHSFCVSGGIVVHNSACTTRFLAGCFAAGTKINTELGYKNIENITIGDKVLTHDGSYQKIVKTHNNGQSNRLIEINGITCTEDHLFYVVEKNMADLINDNNIHEYAYWLEAAKISENKHYVIEIV